MRKNNLADNLIIAHRGIFDNKNIPENSLKAIQKAVTEKIPIEIDIQVLKDKNIIVFHDFNLKRMTNIAKMVSDMNLEDIKKLQLLNTKEKIPTLKEVLTLVKGKVLLDIEIKGNNYSHEDLEIIAKELDNYTGTFIIKSFNFLVLNWFKKNRKNYIVGILLSSHVKPRRYKLMLYFLTIFVFKYDFYACDKNLIDTPLIKYIRRRKIPILVWTVRSRFEIALYKKLANGIICENIF